MTNISLHSWRDHDDAPEREKHLLHFSDINAPSNAPSNTPDPERLVVDKIVDALKQMINKPDGAELHGIVREILDDGDVQHKEVKRFLMAAQGALANLREELRGQGSVSSLPAVPDAILTPQWFIDIAEDAGLISHDELRRMYEAHGEKRARDAMSSSVPAIPSSPKETKEEPTSDEALDLEGKTIEELHMMYEDLRKGSTALPRAERLKRGRMMSRIRAEIDRLMPDGMTYYEYRRSLNPTSARSAPAEKPAPTSSESPARTSDDLERLRDAKYRLDRRIGSRPSYGNGARSIFYTEEDARATQRFMDERQQRKLDRIRRDEARGSYGVRVLDLIDKYYGPDGECAKIERYIQDQRRKDHERKLIERALHFERTIGKPGDAEEMLRNVGIELPADKRQPPSVTIDVKPIAIIADGGSAAAVRREEPKPQAAPLPVPEETIATPPPARPLRAASAPVRAPSEDRRAPQASAETREFSPTDRLNLIGSSIGNVQSAYHFNDILMRDRAVGSLTRALNGLPDRMLSHYLDAIDAMKKRGKSASDERLPVVSARSADRFTLTYESGIRVTAEKTYGTWLVRCDWPLIQAPTAPSPAAAPVTAPSAPVTPSPSAAPTTPPASADTKKENPIEKDMAATSIIVKAGHQSNAEGQAYLRARDVVLQVEYKGASMAVGMVRLARGHYIDALKKERQALIEQKPNMISPKSADERIAEIDATIQKLRDEEEEDLRKLREANPLPETPSPSPAPTTPPASADTKKENPKGVEPEKKQPNAMEIFDECKKIYNGLTTKKFEEVLNAASPESVTQFVQSAYGIQARGLTNAAPSLPYIRNINPVVSFEENYAPESFRLEYQNGIKVKVYKKEGAWVVEREK